MIASRKTNVGFVKDNTRSNKPPILVARHGVMSRADAVALFTDGVAPEPFAQFSLWQAPGSVMSSFDF